LQPVTPNVSNAVGAFFAVVPGDWSVREWQWPENIDSKLTDKWIPFVKASRNPGGGQRSAGRDCLRVNVDFRQKPADNAVIVDSGAAF
jgi:hypothetical protein